MTGYAELQVATHFSFLRGASSPDELMLRAFELGLAGIAVTDRNTLAGIVRMHRAAKEVSKLGRLRLVIGARLDFIDAPSLLCFPQDRAAYGRLSQMLTDGKRQSEKGQCTLTLNDLFTYGDGQRLIALPVEQPDAAFLDHLKKLKRRFGKQVTLAAHHLYRGDDAKRLARLGALADAAGISLVATNDVHAHIASRRPLQDVLTCIREGCTVAEAGFRLNANAERHLKSPDEMARLFRARPDAIAGTLEIMEACAFSLDELKYEYPAEPAPEGRTPQEELARLVRLHAPGRYPDGVPPKVQALLEKELALIEKLDYARYFLTVHDIVAFAKKEEILCQGRGSAANSAVCYVLGITAVNPETTQLLIERFLSEERKEPPDIDVDFEHERREEVMQYIYNKYGRDRAGIVATLVTYRPKSAIRDVGKAMGLSEDVIGILSKTLWGWGREGIQDDYIREAGLDPAEPNLRNALILAKQLMGFPRHLSQHTGGFVITRGKLSEIVPIENAAMEDRTVIEWDKDDLDVLGMLKIDVLALGMLTCLRKGFELLKTHYGVERHLYDNEEDPAVYDMLCEADSVGVFQVESRAQMTMLPRLRPRKLYDLVIEVAIVRPGPIQGDMVHPYLARRSGKEKEELPSEELREVLSRTCGVPLFQEQAMQIAIVAAKFTPDEANRLRRAMATFRHNGAIGTLKERFIEGMVNNNYERDFAERCFRQIEGFGEYGFPESHAASFALLVYASSWIKCHYPDVFACAILNSQPMGFYNPAQLVRDAIDHGVEVRPVDVTHSHWDCTLEEISLEIASPLEGEVGDATATILDRQRSPPPGNQSVADFPLQGGGKRGENLLAFRQRAQRLTQNQQDSFHIPQHVVVPESEDAVAPRLEPGAANSTVIGMLPAIDLDDQRSLRTEEIDDIGTDRLLPAQAESVDLLSPHLEPQSRLGIGEIGAQMPGEMRGHARMLSFRGLDRHPLKTGASESAPPPLRGRSDTALRVREGGKSADPPKPQFALRLGFRQLKGFSEADANAIVAAREQGDFATMRTVWLRAGLGARALETLAKGDGWNSVDLDRRGALWAAKGLGARPLPLFTAAQSPEPAVILPSMSMGQEVTEDYRHLGLSLKQHPLALLRDSMTARRIAPAARLKSLRDGAKIEVAGLVLIRQQPGTASGVIFVTLEDETGIANIVVWPRVFQRFRRALLGSQLMAARGLVQRDESGQVIHVVADRLTDLSAHLHALGDPPDAYGGLLSRADEAKSGPTERHAGAHRRVMPASRDFR
jgi:error-prone DNA polymerase